MPKTAEFTGDPKNATWRTRDTDVGSIRDYLLTSANAAGYQSFVITLSEGAIYDLLLVRGQTAYGINLTLGSDATILTATRVGVMRLQVPGPTGLDIELPMRTRVDTAPGTEVSIGTSVPSPQCPGCVYFVNVHIAPFKGVGNYDSKPGISIIDVELVPGGDYDRDNYRWASSCTVVVKETGGNFDCRGLQNMNDPSKRLDVSGVWMQPPP